MSQIANPALIPPGGLAPTTGTSTPTKATPADQGQGDFAKALEQASDLQFSRHALARVQRRGIELDQGTLQRLSDGVSRAAGKGSRDSLVLVDDTAFVVSVANNTVITAVDSQHMKENVFTNIDSAVIA
jgi:flagellar operon protein